MEFRSQRVPAVRSPSHDVVPISPVFNLTVVSSGYI